MDLLTGATGFVGPHLAQALLARGRRVRCIVRDLSRAAALVALGAEVQECSLLDPLALSRALAGVQRVFHLAGGGRVSTASDAGLSLLRASNVAPLEAVIAAARGSRVERIVHFSSISAMGVQLDVRLDEDSPCQPQTPHEIAKYESEQVALEAWRRHRVPVVILRPSQIYGPGDAHSEIPRLVRLARRGLVPLFGGGEGLVPWVFVSDVVDAAIAAAERPVAVGRTYIVSDAESYRFADVVRSIARSLGRSRGGIPVSDRLARPAIRALEGAARLFARDPPFTLHRLASVSGRRMLRIDRARRDLDYVPRIGLEQGMARTVGWYVERGIA